MTTNEAPPCNPLIEQLIAITDSFNKWTGASGGNAYEGVSFLLDLAIGDEERIKRDMSDRYIQYLDKLYWAIRIDMATSDIETLVACYEQILDDMDDLEDNCNE